MSKALANIHPKAQIAPDVTIEPFATIYEDVVIGSGCWIGPNTVIMNGSRIGKNCKIYPGAVIAGEPQDLKFSGEKTTAEIGDNTVVREFVTINRGTKSKERTCVGNNCLIMSYVHIAHDCMVKDRVIMGSYSGLAGEVEVDNWAIISPGSLVHQFVRVGAHTMIQGMSKVSKDVPPYVLAGRDPLSFTGINSIGLRRRNFDTNIIYAIQDTYRIIYQKGLNISDAVDFVEATLPASNERDEIILFIRNSKRGIIRGYFDNAVDE
ncbi:MAG: acyl-ACP--UDP-N-acetylglucosamine O-acyltransferase [Bacteroidales bacterium]|nr:acyl-ACP--UDP-N-acetylglucosamine O-acyltransferase [Bacteroidales bacterium]MBN2697937.1 acyl-ACP--UDP-N-acetylglucosamine O-acyltransferase [Bacteroidales bacterium]